jgi:(2Fe-2S) ferredoxin
MTPLTEIWVCQDRSCFAQGSAAILAEFVAQTEDQAQLQPIACECQGQCNMSVTVRVIHDDIWYCRVQLADVGPIVEQHLLQNQPVQALLHPRWHPPG